MEEYGRFIEIITKQNKSKKNEKERNALIETRINHIFLRDRFLNGWRNLETSCHKSIELSWRNMVVLFSYSFIQTLVSLYLSNSFIRLANVIICNKLLSLRRIVTEGLNHGLKKAPGDKWRARLDINPIVPLFRVKFFLILVNPHNVSYTHIYRINNQHSDICIICI